jgi:hypothetical protein
VFEESENVGNKKKKTQFVHQFVGSSISSKLSVDMKLQRLVKFKIKKKMFEFFPINI